MRIESVQIELGLTDSEAKAVAEGKRPPLEKRILVLSNSKWRAAGSDPGIYPGEARLIAMLDKVRQDIGSI